MMHRLVAFGFAGLWLLAACRRAPPSEGDWIVAQGAGLPIPPSPAEQAARLAALPLCAPTGQVPADWSRVPVRPLTGASLRLPAGAQDRPDEVPDTSVQVWDLPTLGDVAVQLDHAASLSSGFAILPGDSTRRFVNEGECVASIAGRRLGLRRALLVPAQSARPAQGAETLFILTTDVPFAPDSQLGVGLSAVSRAGLDSLLAALLTLELPLR